MTELGFTQQQAELRLVNFEASGSNVNVMLGDSIELDTRCTASGERGLGGYRLSQNCKGWGG